MEHLAQQRGGLGRRRGCASRGRAHAVAVGRAGRGGEEQALQALDQREGGLHVRVAGAPALLHRRLHARQALLQALQRHAVALRDGARAVLRRLQLLAELAVAVPARARGDRGGRRRRSGACTPCAAPGPGPGPCAEPSRPLLPRVPATITALPSRPPELIDLVLCHLARAVRLLGAQHRALAPLALALELLAQRAHLVGQRPHARLRVAQRVRLARLHGGPCEQLLRCAALRCGGAAQGSGGRRRRRRRRWRGAGWRALPAAAAVRGDGSRPRCCGRADQSVREAGAHPVDQRALGLRLARPRRLPPCAHL